MTIQLNHSSAAASAADLTQAERISVVGLGKLGLPLAVCLASGGHEVVGVDLDDERVRRVQEGDVGEERDLPELLQRVGNGFRATTDTETAVLETDMTFVLVPTPSDADGRFSSSFLLEAIELIGSAIRRKETRHLVVVASTVTPGTTGGEVLPALESSSGKRVGPDVGLCYCPEFVALGQTVKGFLRPDLVLIGESDASSGKRLGQAYARMCGPGVPIRRMSFLNAELAKVTLNVYICSKITFANAVARLCETLPGADVDTVTEAVGLDHRIGRAYLKGATPYGGPCFPRDVACLSALTRDLDASARFIGAIHRHNEETLLHLVDLATSALRAPEETVGILGLAFKPGTTVIEGSVGIEIAMRLHDRGAQVVTTDPLVGSATPGLPGAGLLRAVSLPDCLAMSDVVVIANPSDEFRDIGTMVDGNAGRPHTVIDCWRVLSEKQAEAFETYVAVGVGPVR